MAEPRVRIYTQIHQTRNSVLSVAIPPGHCRLPPMRGRGSTCPDTGLPWGTGAVGTGVRRRSGTEKKVSTGPACHSSSPSPQGHRGPTAMSQVTCARCFRGLPPQPTDAAFCTPPMAGAQIRGEVLEKRNRQ